jgi:hypothetical protein
MIDRRLSSYMSSAHLMLFIETIKRYESLYDGVEWFTETIRMGLSEKQLCHRIESAASTTGHRTKTWGHFVAAHPTCYLRLAITIDLSFSHGRLPEEQDFPTDLQESSDGIVNSLHPTPSHVETPSAPRDVSLSLDNNSVESTARHSAMENARKQQMIDPFSGWVDLDDSKSQGSRWEETAVEFHCQHYMDRKVGTPPPATYEPAKSLEDETATISGLSPLKEWLTEMDVAEDQVDQSLADYDDAGMLSSTRIDDWMPSSS